MRAASISFCGTAPSSCSKRLTALGDGQLRFQFGRAARSGCRARWHRDRPQVGQHFALGDLSPGRRHALWARDDAAGEHGLHPAAGIRIGNDLAVQFDRRRQFGDAHRLGAHAELALHRLRHEQAAVGQALQRCVTPVVPTADTAAGAFFLAS